MNGNILMSKQIWCRLNLVSITSYNRVKFKIVHCTESHEFEIRELKYKTWKTLVEMTDYDVEQKYQLKQNRISCLTRDTC